MPPPTRTVRPTCPACGFRVFNRRYPKCEKCGAPLPEAIVYTAAELATMRDADQRSDEERARRRAREQGARATRGIGLVDNESPASLLPDLLDLGSDLLDGD